MGMWKRLFGGDSQPQSRTVRVIVGTCTACGRDLRVKESGVKPHMWLTCKCGHRNEIGHKALQRRATDVCGKCRRTRGTIEREFEQAEKMPGVAVIGSGDVLLYCDNCKKYFCGACQIDLGWNSGCPICRKALD